MHYKQGQKVSVKGKVESYVEYKVWTGQHLTSRQIIGSVPDGKIVRVCYKQPFWKPMECIVLGHTTRKIGKIISQYPEESEFHETNSINVICVMPYDKHDRYRKPFVCLPEQIELIGEENGI